MCKGKSRPTVGLCIKVRKFADQESFAMIALAADLGASRCAFGGTATKQRFFQGFRACAAAEQLPPRRGGGMVEVLWV
jgi:hypothetical protein